MRGIGPAAAGAAGVLACAFVAYRVFPARVPHDGKPGFVDTIFASTVVVFGARVVLLALAAMLVVAAGFIVLSIWRRRRAGQWVNTFGPFETGALEPTAQAGGELARAWDASRPNIQWLESALADALRDVEDLHRRLRDEDGSDA